jgi:hypothetical protein
LFWLGIGGLVVALLWAVTDSKSARDCIHNRKDNQSYQALHKNAGLLVVVVTRTKLHIACGFIAAGKNEGTLTALSGIAIAAFTLTLWIATTGLLRATNRSIVLAEREFVSAHPPHIIVRRVSLDEGSGGAASGNSRQARIQYVIANTGLGVATVYEGNASVAVFENGLPAIPPFGDEYEIDLPISLASGESVPQTVDLPKAAIDKVTTASWVDVAAQINLASKPLPRSR